MEGIVIKLGEPYAVRNLLKRLGTVPLSESTIEPTAWDSPLDLISASFFVTSETASSQDIFSHFPSPLFPTLFNGVFTRVGP